MNKSILKLICKSMVPVVVLLLSCFYAQLVNASYIPSIECYANDDISVFCDIIKDSMEDAIIKGVDTGVINVGVTEGSLIKIEIKRQNVGSNTPDEYYAKITLITEQGECINKRTVSDLLKKYDNNLANLSEIFIEEITLLYKECENRAFAQPPIKIFEYKISSMYINDNPHQMVIPVGTAGNLFHLKDRPAPILISMTNHSGSSVRVNLSVDITGCESSGETNTKCAETWNSVYELESLQPFRVPIYPVFLRSAFKEVSTPAQLHVVIRKVEDDQQDSININEEHTSKLELLPYNEFAWKQNVIDVTTGEWKLLPLDDIVKLLISWIDIESPVVNAFYDQYFHGEVSNIFDDLSHNEIDRSKEMVGALYNILKDVFSARYNSQTMVFDEYAQRIRLPQQVFSGREGNNESIARANSIEWTLLYSSLLLKAEMSPIIIIIPGHAMLGWRPSFSSKNIFVLETTNINESGFEEALVSGEETLKKCVVGGQTIYDIMKQRDFFTDNSVEVIGRKDYDTKGNTTCKPIFGWDDAVAVFIDVKRVMFDEHFDAMGLIKDSENQSEY